MTPWLIISASVAIIFTVTVAGIDLFGGWEYKVLYLPSSAHDFIQLALLGFGIVYLVFHNNKKNLEYVTTCSALLAAFFFAALVMQLIDERPAGLWGSLGIYLDIPVNGLIAVGFMIVLFNLRRRHIIEPDNRRRYLTGLLCLFLALNFAFSVKAAMMAPEAFKPLVIYYDTCFYLLLTLTALMSNPWLHDALYHLCSRAYIVSRRRVAAYLNHSK